MEHDKDVDGEKGKGFGVDRGDLNAWTGVQGGEVWDEETEVSEGTQNTKK